ncbi:MAG: YgjV family protein [Pseudomonadota bacterium]
MSDIFSYQIITQAVGILASAFIVGGYFSKCDVKTKRILMIGSLFFAIHFYMLGAITAMIINLINIFRVGLSIKFHKSKFLFAFFIGIYSIALIFTYEGWIDIFPFLATVTSCIGMYFLSGISFRKTSAVGAVFWLVHNIMSASWGGIITEVFILKAHIVTIYRLKRDDKRSQNET